MRLPKKIELGNLPITFVSAYNQAKGNQMKAALESAPRLFIDLEAPQPEFQVQKSLELHLGVQGAFTNARLYSNNVQSHIDIYLPIEAVIEFLVDHADSLFNFYSTCKSFKFSNEEIRFLARKKLMEVIKVELS